MSIQREYIKFFIFLTGFLLFIHHLFAQKVVVEEFTLKIENVEKQGMQTTLVLEEQEVTKAWVKKLKEFGKVEANEHIFKVEIATIPSIQSNPVKIISQLSQLDKGTQIFWSIDLGNKILTSEQKEQYAQAEKILHDFGVLLYREDINENIKEAEKVLQKTVSIQEKKIREGEDLVKRIEKNKLQKAQLEQKLIDNANELITLQQKVEQNKLDQESAQKDVDKVKRQVEATKNKLTQVE